jgi:hypothetical protein
MASSDRLPEEDEGPLTEAIRGGPFPPVPPGLDARVKHLVRRRRRQRRAALGIAALAVTGLTGFALWDIAIRSPSTSPPAAAVPSSPAVEAASLKELRLIVAAPPVVPVLSQQDAWLRLLEEECKGVEK